jgi:hypothetical protein
MQITSACNSLSDAHDARLRTNDRRPASGARRKKGKYNSSDSPDRRCYRRRHFSHASFSRSGRSTERGRPRFFGFDLGSRFGFRLPLIRPAVQARFNRALAARSYNEK